MRDEIAGGDDGVEFDAARAQLAGRLEARLLEIDAHPPAARTRWEPALPSWRARSRDSDRRIPVVAGRGAEERDLAAALRRAGAA